MSSSRASRSLCFHRAGGVLLSLLAFTTLLDATTATAPAIGDVVINEFVSNPTTGDVEWVELYNRRTTPFVIGGFWVDDALGTGGAAKSIPADTVINGEDFFVLEVGSSFLNNGGDDVILIASDGQTVHDQYTYSSSTSGLSWCRRPDGGDWAMTECTPTRGASNGLGEQPWEPGTFDWRVFDVEQGSSSLIIFPSGFSVLYDAGEISWNSKRNSAMIAQAIKEITGGTHVDVGIMGHFHADHVGYPQYGGFWALLEQHSITFNKILHQDAGAWVDSNADNVCDPSTEIVYHNFGLTSGTVNEWICYMSDTTLPHYSVFETAVKGSSAQISPGGVGEKVTILGTDGKWVNQADGSTPVWGDQTSLTTPPSANDYSIVLRAEWHNVSLIIGGDIDGVYATSSFGYTYNDVESALVDEGVVQCAELVLANHHGSGNSNNEKWVTATSPQAVLFSCGDGNSYGHPDQAVLDRYHNNQAQMYLTNMCTQVDRTYYGARHVNHHIHVLSSDGHTFTVDGDEYTARCLDMTQSTPEPTSPPCSLGADGEQCRTNNDCCSGYCQGSKKNKVCATPEPPAPTSTPVPTATPTPTQCPLAADGESCKKSSDCCSGICEGGKNKVCSPAGAASHATEDPQEQVGDSSGGLNATVVITACAVAAVAIVVVLMLVRRRRIALGMERERRAVAADPPNSIDMAGYV